jgi:hypothetical protein
MKLKDSEKALLLGLVGVAVAGLSILYVAKPNYESKQSIDAECAQLQLRLTDLQTKMNDKEKYVSETEECNKGYDELLNRFPADLNQEVTIMFLDGIMEDNDFSVSTLEMGEQEQFYVLGTNGGDAVLDTSATTDASTTDTSSTDDTTDSTSEDTTTTDTAASLTVDEDNVVDSSYRCIRAEFPISYYGDYDSVKDVVSYVNNYQDRMTVDSIDITYDSANEVYSGSISLTCYAITSTDRPERKLELDDVETGVSNIFTSGGSSVGSSDSGESLNKYDENDGASIESDYDFYAMLNAASSDVSAKVVGQNGTGKEASIISNSDDSVSTLTYDFYEKDGKNYCKYTLDTASYEAEVTSAEDIKVLIQSSAKKSSDDNAGVRVTIRNTTSLPVYVKVSGDDSTSPRVDIASKSGTVKVYK